MRICQCWDDGVLDDVRLCEILRRHRATASFNLNAGLHRGQRFESWKYQGTKPVFKLAIGELRDVYRGFTVANHTLTHPHPKQLDDAMLRHEIVEGRERLQDIFGAPVLGFAYPFGEHDQRVMDAVRAAGHVYARTCVNVETLWPVADPMACPTCCHFKSPQFWDRYAAARAADGVFYFWGHSYEFLSDDEWAAFDAAMARISADPAAQWVELPDLFA